MVNKVGNCLVTIYRCITVRLTVSSYGQMAIRKMRQNKNIHITLCPEGDTYLIVTQVFPHAHISGHALEVSGERMWPYYELVEEI